jgi:hypothetical protein
VKRHLLITIDVDETSCDDCEHHSRPRCDIWGGLVDVGRLPQCIEAERRATVDSGKHAAAQSE